MLIEGSIRFSSTRLFNHIFQNLKIPIRVFFLFLLVNAWESINHQREQLLNLLCHYQTNAVIFETRMYFIARLLWIISKKNWYRLHASWFLSANNLHWEHVVYQNTEFFLHQPFQKPSKLFLKVIYLHT